MGFFFADALHDVGQVRMPVLRYSRQWLHCGDRLLLLVVVDIASLLSAAFSRVITEKCVGGHSVPILAVLVGACVSSSYVRHLHARRGSPSICAVLFLNASLLAL